MRKSPEIYFFPLTIARSDTGKSLYLLVQTRLSGSLSDLPSHHLSCSIPHPAAVFNPAIASRGVVAVALSQLVMNPLHVRTFLTGDPDSWRRIVRKTNRTIGILRNVKCALEDQ